MNPILKLVQVLDISISAVYSVLLYQTGNLLYMY